MSTTGIIPSDAPSVFELLDSLSTLQRQAIIRPTNPPPGLAGFLFDINEDDEINLRADITDHFVENNTVIVDQIGLKPEEYTVRGLVAELVAIPPAPDVVAKVPNPLDVNSDLLPVLTPQAAQEATDNAQTEASANAALQQSSSLWGYFLDQAPKPPNQTRQSRTFLYFYQLWKARELFTIETPWGFFTDMAILTLRASQDDESRFKSSFTVTFKKIRTAGGATITAGQLAGRANLQMAPVTNNGTGGTKPLTKEEYESLLVRLGGNFFR